MQDNAVLSNLDMPVDVRALEIELDGLESGLARNQAQIDCLQKELDERQQDIMLRKFRLMLEKGLLKGTAWNVDKASEDFVRLSFKGDRFNDDDLNPLEQFLNVQFEHDSIELLPNLKDEYHPFITVHFYDQCVEIKILGLDLAIKFIRIAGITVNWPGIVSNIERLQKEIDRQTEIINLFQEKV